MILYNIRRGPIGHQLGKFDDDFNVVAIYDVSLKSCTCPAGVRPSCKHRKMLPRMLTAVDTDQFYCYETQQWHTPLGDLARPQAAPSEGKALASEASSSELGISTKFEQPQRPLAPSPSGIRRR